VIKCLLLWFNDGGIFLDVFFTVNEFFMTKLCPELPRNYRTYPALAMDEVMNTFEKTKHTHLEPINFGKGVSSFNPFEHVETQLNCTDLSKHISYGDINGLLSLRQAICDYYQIHFNYELTPERVCITDGASGGLMIALAMLLEKGGEIILPASCYPAYSIFAKMFETQCRFAPLKDDFSIDVEQLPKLISNKTQAILINSPSNPHGTFLTQAELEALSDLGVPVIFDEVYQSLALSNQKIPSAIQLTHQHFLVNSLSKSLAIAGFRVGYLIVPEHLAKTMTNVKAVVNMCTSLPSQTIAEKLLAHWDELIAKHQAMLRHNWAIFQQHTGQLGLRLKTQPKAGFFALVDVSQAEKSDMQIAQELAQYHALGSSPGVDFQLQDTACLRLNFACPTQQIKTGLQRLADYLSDSNYSVTTLNTHKSIPITVPPSIPSLEPMRRYG